MFDIEILNWKASEKSYPENVNMELENIADYVGVSVILYYT
jgi:hypothetical protein